MHNLNKKLITFLLINLLSISTNSLLPEQAPAAQPTATQVDPAVQIDEKDAKDLAALPFSDKLIKLLTDLNSDIDKASKKLGPDDELTKQRHKLIKRSLAIQKIKDSKKGKELAKLEERLSQGFDFPNNYKFLQNAQYTMTPIGTSDADAKKLGKMGKIEIAAMMLDKISTNESGNQIRDFIRYCAGIRALKKTTIRKKVFSPSSKEIGKEYDQVIKNIKEMTFRYANKLLIPLWNRMKKGAAAEMNLRKSGDYLADGKYSAPKLLNYLGVTEGANEVKLEQVINFPAEFKLAKKLKGTKKAEALESIIDRFSFVKKYKDSEDDAEDFIKEVTKLKKEIGPNEMEKYKVLVKKTLDKFKPEEDINNDKVFKEFKEFAASVEGGFFFDTFFKTLKNSKSLTEKFKVATEMIEKMTKDNAEPDEVEDFLGYFVKTKKVGTSIRKLIFDPSKKVKLATRRSNTIAYAKLLDQINKKIEANALDLSKSSEFKKAGKDSYARWLQYLGGDPTKAFNFPVEFEDFDKEKTPKEKIEKAENLVNRAVFTKGFSQSKSDAKKLLDELRIGTKKILTSGLIPRYQAIIKKAQQKTKGIYSSKNFNSLVKEVESGALEYYTKLTLLKKEKSIDRQLMYLEQILKGAPAIYFKKKRKTTKARIKDVKKDVVKANKKRWNQAYTNRLIDIISLAKPKVTGYTKTFTKYILELYDKPLDKYRDALKDIQSANKKLVSYVGKCQKARNTVKSLKAKGIVKESRNPLRKGYKLYKANNDVKNYCPGGKYPKKQNTRKEKAEREAKEAESSLRGAPADVTKKMNEYKSKYK